MQSGEYWVMNSCVVYWNLLLDTSKYKSRDLQSTQKQWYDPYNKPWGLSYCGAMAFIVPTYSKMGDLTKSQRRGQRARRWTKVLGCQRAITILVQFFVVACEVTTWAEMTKFWGFGGTNKQNKHAMVWNSKKLFWSLYLINLLHFEGFYIPLTLLGQIFPINSFWKGGMLTKWNLYWFSWNEESILDQSDHS